MKMCKGRRVRDEAEKEVAASFINEKLTVHNLHTRALIKIFSNSIYRFD